MVNAVGESFGSGSCEKPWSCLHAASQLRQPMHLVMSIRIALLLGIPFSFVTSRSVEEEFADDPLTQLRVDALQKTTDGNTAILREGGIEFCNLGVEPGLVVV